MLYNKSDTCLRLLLSPAPRNGLENRLKTKATGFVAFPTIFQFIQQAGNMYVSICMQWTKGQSHKLRNLVNIWSGFAYISVSLLFTTRWIKIIWHYFAVADANQSQGHIPYLNRPRWLSWMHRPTGDQEVAGSTPAKVGNILSWRLIMKYFLRSFSPFHWFKKGSCQFLAKECAQYWLTA